MDPYSIIVNPVVTEKSTLLQEKGKYTFDVYKSSSIAAINIFEKKSQFKKIIGQALKAAYNRSKKLGGN